MNRGYIRLYRKIMDNPVLHERGKRWSKFEAWVYLCLSARGTDDPNGLKRGEFECSIRYLAQAWNWSKSAVERFLSDLQQDPDPMIMRLGHLAGHQAGQFAGHFSICKYETYNPARDGLRDTKRDTSRDKYNKGINEGSNESLTTSQAAGAAAVDSPPSIESARLSELLRSRIAARDGNAKAGRLPVHPSWARDIDKLLRIDGRRSEDIEAVIAWCQSDGCFWGPNILSGRKLREKFDTMWGQMRRDNGHQEPSMYEQMFKKKEAM